MKKSFANPCIWVGGALAASNVLRLIVQFVTGEYGNLPFPPAILFGCGIALAVNVLLSPPEIEETDWQWGIFDHRWYCIGYKHVKGNF